MTRIQNTKRSCLVKRSYSQCVHLTSERLYISPDLRFMFKLFLLITATILLRVLFLPSPIFKSHLAAFRLANRTAVGV